MGVNLRTLPRFNWCSGPKYTAVVSAVICKALCQTLSIGSMVQRALKLLLPHSSEQQMDGTSRLLEKVRNVTATFTMNWLHQELVAISGWRRGRMAQHT